MEEGHGWREENIRNTEQRDDIQTKTPPELRLATIGRFIDGDGEMATVTLLCWIMENFQRNFIAFKYLVSYNSENTLHRNFMDKNTEPLSHILEGS